MGQREDHNKAYADGRRDGAKPGHGDLDAGKVLTNLVTGLVPIGVTGITQDNRNPPGDPGLRETYERGFRDEQDAQRT
jgi:hypothetical protein